MVRTLFEPLIASHAPAAPGRTKDGILEPAWSLIEHSEDCFFPLPLAEELSVFGDITSHGHEEILGIGLDFQSGLEFDGPPLRFDTMSGFPGKPGFRGLLIVGFIIVSFPRMIAASLDLGVPIAFSFDARFGRPKIAFPFVKALGTRSASRLTV